MLFPTKVIIPILLMMSVAVMFVAPIASQTGPISKATLTKTHGPPQVTSTSTVILQGHGRHGQGVPPGLLNAWAHSNMSVVAWAVTHAIFLNGTHGVQLAWIAINASTNGQTIRNVAYNQTVLQVAFDHDGSVELSAESSAKPKAVYADDMELSEVPTSFGLTPSSEAWTYDQSSHVLAVFADPSTITILYGPKPSPDSEFTAYTGALAGILITTVALALIIAKANKPREP